MNAGEVQSLPVDSNGAFPAIAEKSLHKDASPLEFEDAVEVSDIFNDNLVDICDSKSFSQSGVFPLAAPEVGDSDAAFYAELVQSVNG